MNKVAIDRLGFDGGEAGYDSDDTTIGLPHPVLTSPLHITVGALGEGALSVVSLADGDIYTSVTPLHSPAFETHVDFVTGTHARLIGSGNGETGIEVAGSDTIPASTGTSESIGFNTSDIGYASSATDHDWFRLHVVAGLSYTVSADKLVDLSGQLLGLNDPFLTLRNSSGVVLATNNDHGGTLNAEITFTATSTGDVYLDVNSNSGQLGYYTVGLVDTIGNTTATASPLAIGTSNTAMIEDSNDSDWFAVTLVAGKSYDFSLSGYSTDGLADPNLELRDSAGNIVVSNDDISYPGNINSFLHFTATTGGTYYLAASGSALASTQDEAAGIYTIRAVQSNDVYADNSTTTGTLTPGHSVTSVIDSQGDADWFAVTLEAGYIYNFALNGAGGSPLNDPYLELYDANGQRVAFNDDGGAGLNSALAFYAASGGTYYISAESFPNDPPATNIGGYTLSMGARVTPTVDGGNTDMWHATALTLGASQAANIDIPGDQDWYAVDLVAGQGYDFDIKGLSGFNGSLSVYNGSGHLIARNDDFGAGTDAHLDFEPLESGTYYLVAEGSGGTTYGGYTVQASSGARPLLTDSIDWGTKLTPAGGVVKVYFANSGETYDGQTSEGWTAYEIQQAMAALGTYAHAINLTFVRTTNAAEADFKLVTVASLDSGDDGTTLAYMNPPGTTNAGVGVFATDNPYWSDHAGGALDQGGIGFTTLIHELGHGLGLAHPFDNGGTSTVMTGVLNTYDYSGYGWQNQGVYTVMSYNDGWPGGPFSTGTYYGPIYAYAATPMAIDIAALQAKYGANTTFNTANNVYYLEPGINHQGRFQSIWDAGGYDMITAAHVAADQNVYIDLRAASMYYTDGNSYDGNSSPYGTSGGAVSRVEDVNGGLTIAQGVVIERADGHAGHDVLRGNDGGNILDGKAGGDTIYGAGGNDIIIIDFYTARAGWNYDIIDGGTGTDSLTINVAYTDVTGYEVPDGSGTIIFTLNGYSSSSITVNNVETFKFTDGTYDFNHVVNHRPTLKGTLMATVAVGGTHVITTSELGFEDLNGTPVTFYVMPGIDSLTGEIREPASTHGWITINNTIVSSFTSDQLAAGQVVFVHDGTQETMDASFRVTLSDGQLYSMDYATFQLTATGGTVGNVTIKGTADGDTLRTGAGADTLVGNGGNDILDGGAGSDTMIGGTGDDIYYYTAGDVMTELAGGGIDLVIAANNYTLGDQFENLRLANGAIAGTGNALANVITGNELANTLIGLGGNDTLNGGAGADSLAGGLGDDIYYVDNVGDKVFESVNQGTDTVYSTVTYSLAGQHIENLIFTGAANLNGTGNGLNNAITGNSGNNYLIGGDGNDTLNGGTGTDVMTGGLGDDRFYVDNTGDKVVELTGQGTDSVFSSVTFSLGGQYIENLTLSGTGSINAMGNALNNTLVGNSGDNVLDGNLGADMMSGGLGNDTYYIDNSGDRVTELTGEGTDTVISSLSYALGDFIENLTLTGSGNLNGVGNGLANTITGNTGNNTIVGGQGADTMVGGLGNDTYYVDNPGDKVVESANQGTDSVFSSVSFSLVGQHIENLTLAGTANLTGTGNALANTLVGNAGSNTLDGNGGNDTLTGGDGADIFLFGAGSGTDTITDFQAAQNDSLNLHAYSQATAVISQVGNDTVIDLGGGNIITLTGTLKADVTSHITW